MKNEQKQKVLFEFAGYSYIHKPLLAEEINTLIAGFLDSDNTVNPVEPEPFTGIKHTENNYKCCWYETEDAPNRCDPQCEICKETDL